MRTCTGKITKYYKRHVSQIIIASKIHLIKNAGTLFPRLRSPSTRPRLLLSRRILPAHIAHDIRVLLVRVARQPLLAPRGRRQIIFGHGARVDVHLEVVLARARERRGRVRVESDGRVSHDSDGRPVVCVVARI